MYELTVGPYETPLYVFGKLQKGQDALIYLHGNGTTCERQLDLVGRLHQALGLHIVFPEYSGHGRNMRLAYNDITLNDTDLEISEVYEWLAGELYPGRVYVYGGSYGGHVAARLMGKYKLQKVALQAPTVLAEVENGIKMGSFKEIEAKAIREPSVDRTTEAIRTITAGFSGKLMIMRSENDELVPRVVVDAWIAVFPKADYVIIKDALHSVRKSTKKAQNQWIEELKRFLIKG